jgi:hypothetical protein
LVAAARADFETFIHQFLFLIAACLWFHLPLWRATESYISNWRQSIVSGLKRPQSRTPGMRELASVTPSIIRRIDADRPRIGWRGYRS